MEYFAPSHNRHAYYLFCYQTYKSQPTLHPYHLMFASTLGRNWRNKQIMSHNVPGTIPSGAVRCHRTPGHVCLGRHEPEGGR